VNLDVYVGLLRHAERTLAETFRQVAEGHGDEPDVRSVCNRQAKICDQHVDALEAAARRYGEAEDVDEPERLHADGPSETRSGPVGLIRDLQDVYLLASIVDITWTMVGQAAQALRDTDLLDTVHACEGETSTQLAWLKTRMKAAAPQALLVG
jgi:hypothetical protein